jgi:hypothetical protein
MRTKIVDRAEVKSVSATAGTKQKWPALLLLLLSVAFLGKHGCTDYYGNPVRPGYAGYGPYGPGYAGYGSYGPGYGAYPGSVTVEIGDRPYYTRGAGYYVGRSYYVWRPGHWARRHGQRVWVHGHYVVR